MLPWRQYPPFSRWIKILPGNKVSKMIVSTEMQLAKRNCKFLAVKTQELALESGMFMFCFHAVTALLVFFFHFRLPLIIGRKGYFSSARWIERLFSGIYGSIFNYSINVPIQFKWVIIWFAKLRLVIRTKFIYMKEWLIIIFGIKTFNILLFTCLIYLYSYSKYT